MINLSYQNHLKSIITDGKVVGPRNMETLEVLGLQFKYSASYPVITIPERNPGYKAMLAEAFWILSGSNRLDEIQPWMNMKEYSNDGIHLDGAYGPAFIDQVTYVTRTLKEDRHSRRAVMSIWRDRPFDSRDIPCTLTLQFLIRGRMLHTIVNMRSSDAWLGIPYDCFTFAMMARYIATTLSTTYDLDSGDVILNIASSHIYAHNIEDCGKIVEKVLMEEDIEPKVPFKFKTVEELLFFLRNHRDMRFVYKSNNDLQKIMVDRYAA